MAVPFSERVLCEVDEAREALGNIGLTKIYNFVDFNGGPLKTVLLGRRRMINVQSVLKLAEEGYDRRPAKRPRRDAGRRRKAA